jgi:hypothetical protein
MVWLLIFFVLIFSGCATNKPTVPEIFNPQNGEGVTLR